MNVLNKQKQEEILTLIIAGHSFRKIAKRLHVGRSTVSEYAKAHRVIAKKGRTGGIEPKSPAFSVCSEAESCSSSCSPEICSAEPPSLPVAQFEKPKEVSVSSTEFNQQVLLGEATPPLETPPSSPIGSGSACLPSLTAASASNE